MKKLFFALCIVLAGCQISPQTVRENYLVGKFASTKSVETTQQIVYDMMRFCSKPGFEVTNQAFPALKKATVSMKLKSPNLEHHMFVVDVAQTDAGFVEVSSYAMRSTSTTKEMASTVEKWANYSSKTCSSSGLF